MQEWQLAVNKFLEDPLAWLSMGTYHGSFVFWIAVGLGVLVESLLYFVWYWRAKKKAEEEAAAAAAAAAEEEKEPELSEEVKLLMEIRDLLKK